MSAAPSTIMDRHGAAVLLQTARAGGEAAAREAIDWAHLALPGCVAILRLKIRQLMLHSDHAAADALIARGLRIWPDDATLRLLRAQRLYERGEMDEAWSALGELFRLRPHHGATAILAGRIALARNDHAVALSLLQRAAALGPPHRRDEARIALIEAQLTAGRPDDAEAVLHEVADGPALLWARVRCLQRRWLDAADILDLAALRAADHDERDRLLCELVQSLETIGDVPRLDRILAKLDQSHPRALARAGLTWLARGEFARAARQVRPVVSTTAAGGRALMTLFVAAAMADRPNLACRALARLERLVGAIDTQDFARIWRSGIRGRLLADQRCAATAGADPEAGVLGLLLEDAARVFSEDLAAVESESGEIHDVHRHRSSCLAALSQRSGRQGAPAGRGCVTSPAPLT